MGQFSKPQNKPPLWWNPNWKNWRAFPESAGTATPNQHQRHGCSWQRLINTHWNRCVSSSWARCSLQGYFCNFLEQWLFNNWNNYSNVIRFPPARVMIAMCNRRGFKRRCYAGFYRPCLSCVYQCSGHFLGCHIFGSAFLYQIDTFV